MKIEYDKQHEIYSTQADIDFATGPSETMTVGEWRQDRVMKHIKPLIEKGYDWLTVGDGNWGSEARWIIAAGGNAHASDFSTPLLEKAANKGLIKNFSRQNAEQLEFQDDAFDFVLIKEALHHFPRPWLALYEALRVCRLGVVLFEPNGEQPRLISNILRVLRRKSYNAHYKFEPVGNFLYAPNPHELDKLLLGLNLNHSAKVHYNDFWLSKEADAAPLEGGTARQGQLRSKVMKTIRRRDFLSQVGIVPYGKLGYTLLKRTDQYVLSRLEAGGWKINELPSNPYH